MIEFNFKGLSALSLVMAVFLAGVMIGTALGPGYPAWPFMLSIGLLLVSAFLRAVERKV